MVLESEISEIDWFDMLVRWEITQRERETISGLRPAAPPRVILVLEDMSTVRDLQERWFWQLSTKTAEKSSKILKTAEIGNIIPTSDTARKNQIFGTYLPFVKPQIFGSPKIHDTGELK